MPQFPESFDVIVVGGGHAGCEAALAAARLGCSCLLISFDLRRLAHLSCNPAVGGLAKGHLVREIDALGGQMALATDAAGIQFRLLNRGKGPAVWSGRVQVDMELYSKNMQMVLADRKNLHLRAGEVKGLRISQGKVSGVITASGDIWAGRAVVLTTGTFLGGVVHVGLERQLSGRWREPASHSLSQQLKELGLPGKRLKTGTPPRLYRQSLDLEDLPRQESDPDPRLFSFLSRRPSLPQVVCWQTRTNAGTHRLVRDNLTRSPFYSGRTEGAGPRYCPLLEEKIERFPERESHQIFLEPQGLRDELIYPNGIFTALPLEVQTALLHTLPGCRRAKIAQPGYAVEYDMLDPRQLLPSLESKRIPGLFLAGQINGSSGYEEAAAQGLLAGINAARHCQGLPAWILDRSQAYLGVLVDDLVTKGTEEPYRLFTSRSEYRLTLREDNADLRLTPLGRELGLVDDERWRVFCKKRDLLEETWARLERCRLKPRPEFNQLLGEEGQSPLRQPQNALEFLRRPGVNPAALKGLDPALEFLGDMPEEVTEQVYIQARYAGYVEREREQAAAFKQKERVLIPPDFCYDGLPGLSREVQEKLNLARPVNLGQAGRISGVTPAALNILALYLNRRERARGGSREIEQK